MSGPVVTAVVVAGVSFALSLATSLVLSAIAKKPQVAQQPQQRADDNNYNQKINLRTPIGSRQIVYGEDRVGGVMVFAHRTSPRLLHLLFAVAGHQVSAFYGVFMNDEAHWLPAFTQPPPAYTLDAFGWVTGGVAYIPGAGGGGHARFKFYDGTQTTADTDLVTVVANTDIWDSTMALKGIAYCYAQLEHGIPGPMEVLFGNGPPTITPWFRGKLCYDPRDSLTKWTLNPALELLDYMTSTYYGPGIPIANFDLPSWIAAANICDEVVELFDGGQNARYEYGGTFTMDQSYDSVIIELLKHMQGRLIYNGDKYRLLAGAYYGPTGPTITEADLRAGPIINTIISGRDRINSIKGTFKDPRQIFQDVDFPPFSNAAWVTEDGKELWTDLPLKGARDTRRAQRIAKVHLETLRREVTVKLQGNISLWRWQAGDTIAITLPEHGWSAKTFEIKTLSVSLDPDSQVVGVDAECVEVDAGSYSWDGSEEIPVVIPDDPGPSDGDPATVNPVRSLTATEIVVSANGNAPQQSNLRVEWLSPLPDAISEYQVEYKLQSESVWTIWGRVPYTGDSPPVGTTTPINSALIENVNIAPYHIRVAAVNIVGVLSNYVQISSIPSGDTTPPEDVTGFGSFNGISGFTTFVWNGATQAKVRNGGQTIIRFQAVTSGATWAAGTAVFYGDGVTNTAVLETKVGTYMIKFQSSTGVQSLNAASVVITTLDQPKVGIDIVPTLPGSGAFQGQVVFNEADNKLYRWTGSAWTSAVPSTDITGQLTDAQIAAIAATKITGQITNAQIADMAAAKLTGQITTTQITDDAVTAPKISAGSVTTAKLAASSVTAEKILIADFNNYVPNPTFASGAVNWGKNGGGAAYSEGVPTGTQIMAGSGYNGSAYHLSIDIGAASIAVLSPNFAVTPNEQYMLRVTAGWNGTIPSLPLWVQLQFINAAGTPVAVTSGIQDLSFTSADPTGYQTKVIRSDSIVAPAGAVWARVVIYVVGTLATAKWYVGEVTVLKKAGASLIVDGSVSAVHIAAQTITAEKMLIGNTENMVANGNLSLGNNNWGQVLTLAHAFVPTLPANINFLTGSGGYNGSQHVYEFTGSFDANAGGPLWNSNFFPVVPGEKYLLRTATNRRSASGTHTKNLYILLEFWRFDTGTGLWTPVTPADAYYTAAETTDTLDTWILRDSDTYHGGIDNITVPATASRARVSIYNNVAGTIGGAYWIGLVAVYKRMPSQLIVDGAIIAKSLATDSVISNKIQAGAVVAAKISVSNLASVNVDAGSLTAGIITGLLLRTSSGVTRVEMTGSGLVPNAFSVYGDIGGGVSGLLGYFGGTIPTGNGLLGISIPSSDIYPGRFYNTSTTGGGSGRGGGTLRAESVAGWTLEVGCSTTAATLDSAFPIAAIRASAGGGGVVDICRNAGDGGYSIYTHAGTVGPFTGSHDGLLLPSITPEPGDLMVDVTVVARKLSDVLSIMDMSRTAKQQGVLGVFVDRRPAVNQLPAAVSEIAVYIEPDGTEKEIPQALPMWDDYRNDYDLLKVNSVGEGCVNVCAQGGNIAIGDLLCASDIPGKAMKQDDDLVHGYTVARAREAHTFTSPTEVVMLACVYGCG